jgi:para-nitrobenzyl esterase
MMAYWTNFAKTGNPNGPSLPAWPKFTAANEPVLSLDVPNQTVITNFADQHRCKFWDGQNNY